MFFKKISRAHKPKDEFLEANNSTEKLAKQFAGHYRQEKSRLKM